MLSGLDPLRELTLASILLRFILAAVCGGAIGIERGRKRHDAGLRTHAVVCIGAASVMMVNQYLIEYLGSAGDPARMGAQVVSGIGFLGAGTIIITGRQRGQRVKGLTTAAGLWASACMGLALGAGFFEGAVIMCVLLVLVIAVLTRLDKVYVKSAASVQLYVEYLEHVPFSAILCALHKIGWHMTAVEYLKNGGPNRNAVILDVQRAGRSRPISELLDGVRDVEGVLCAEDL